MPHRSLVLLFLLIAFAGCGGQKTSKVAGLITYKGKPVPKANVSFTPLDSTTRAAAGLSDEEGRYTLSTFGINDGALPGKYRVAIVAHGPERPARKGETSSGVPELVPTGMVQGDPIVPTKYFAPDTSGLTFEVKRGSNRADFDLKD